MNLCPVKATMACTVRRSTMSVCLPLAKTTPPVGISSMPMSVSAHPSLKVCVCECIRICFRVLKVLPGELLKALFVCVHAGRHCEIYKDPCLKMRCLNGGRCESAGLNASCSCPPGYLGEHSLTTSCVFLWLWLVMKMNVAAWKMKSGCDPSASLWAVDVIAKKKSFNATLPVCSGEKCEVDVNECDSNPCHHGGTCIDQSNGFTCHCPPGWVGPSCEIRKSPCQKISHQILF